MALSRSSKITIFLAMDTVFFLVELIVGYMIGSLALVADSFHMLNDVLSLLIALYAIKLSTRRTTNARLSYGWNRAEILAALINGVFLIALCFSIAVEAIQRFTAIHEISDPKLLVIVGTIGFFSNVIGLFLFHEHGHGDSLSQERISPGTPTPHPSGASDRPATVTQVSEISLPTPVVTRSLERRISPSTSPTVQGLPDLDLEKAAELGQKHPEPPNDKPKRLDSWIPPLRRVSFSSLYKARLSRPPSPASESPSGPFRIGEASPPTASRKTDSWMPSSLSRPMSYSSLYGHPSVTRAMLIQRAQDIALSQTPSIAGSVVSEREVEVPEVEIQKRESTAVVTATVEFAKSRSSMSSIQRTVSKGHHHHHHHHRNKGNNGHSQGSMNMRSLVLHVLGDALGNIGVIAAGLMIWFAKGKFKYYFDPMISLVITAIIFSSALPLVRSAGFILLQATPTSVLVEDVEESILAVDGVLSFHELHVWQLSESKLVASVHVTTSRIHDFMTVALNIRKALHDLGIHSCTIQPEYDHATETSKFRSSSCLILCPPDQKCDPWQHSCCPPATEV